MLTLIAGFVLQMMNGTQFCVSSITPYIYSYYKDASLTEVNDIFPIMMIVGPLTNFPSSYLTSRGVNPRLLIIFGALIAIGGIFISSIIKENA